MSGVATAIVGAAIIGGAMSAKSQQDAAGKAALSQKSASRRAMAWEKDKFAQQMERYDKEYADMQSKYDNIQNMLSPYVKAGSTALTSQMGLAGLSGREAQAAEIAGLEDSPIFQALTEQGEKAILSKGAATGGLRGGNIQAALAQFRPAMLKNEMESKYSKLQGISGMGMAAAQGPGLGFAPTGGPQGNNNISQLLGNMGDAEAQAALTRGAASSQMYGDVSSSVMMAALMQDGGGGNTDRGVSIPWNRGSF